MNVSSLTFPEAMVRNEKPHERSKLLGVYGSLLGKIIDMKPVRMLGQAVSDTRLDRCINGGWYECIHAILYEA